MQCPSCTRDSRTFYCSGCLSSRLQDQHARRLQLRNALTLVTSKASALLAGIGSGSNSGNAGSSFGVKDERELKAEKWVLASRAYAAREGVAKGKEANAAVEKDLQARRAALSCRRSNLSTARSLLSSLSPPPSTTSTAFSPPDAASLALPLSLPSLESHLLTLRHSLDSLSLETARVRRILAVELLAVFALKPVEPVLADPFSPDPSSSAARRPSRTAPSPAPHYTLSLLPLPPLSLLPTLPPQTLEALLSHLLHLTRLIALYEGVLLPFAVLPACFGPGRGGVRAVGGLVDLGGGGRGGGGGGSEKEGAADEGKKSGGKKKKQNGGVGVDCWPLFFGSISSSSLSSGGKKRDKSSPSSASPAAAASLVGNAAAAGDASSTPLESPSDDEDDPEDGVNDDLFRSASSSSTVTTTAKSTSSRKSRSKPSSSSSSSSSKSLLKRQKAVYTAALCLVYDLAYIAWVRTERQRQQRRRGGRGTKKEKRREWGSREVGEVEDLGGLIRRAAGVEKEEEEAVEGAQGEERGPAGGDPFPSSSPFIDPSSPSASTPRATSPSSPSPSSAPPPRADDPLSEEGEPRAIDFPLSFSELVEHYLSVAFPVNEEGESTVLLGVSGRRREKGQGEGDEEDEEWDFV